MQHFRGTVSDSRAKLTRHTPATLLHHVLLAGCNERMDVIQQVRAARALPAPAIARALRQAAGLSQGQVAEHLGVHRLTLHRWETGANRPRGQHLADYAALVADLQRELAA